VVQPGLARSQMAGAILGRSQGLAGRLPLLGQLVQRYRTAAEFPAGQAPIVYARPRSADVGPTGALTARVPQRLVAQARAAPPVEPGAVSLRPVIRRVAETVPTKALPVVRAKVSPSAKLAASQRAVIQRAAAAGPTVVIPVVQPKVSRLAEPAEWPAVVAQPIKVGERQGQQPTSTLPARPVVAPSRSPVQAGVIQRAPDRLVVVEARRSGWFATPPPEALLRPVSVSNQGQPVGQRAAATVVQRAASGVASSAPVSAGQAASPVIQRANVETEVDLEKLAERDQRELDLEALVARVQRQLKQRLVVESERRGLVQWP
jgi:hypothetical protein